jgi:bacteriophage exclusion system BrxA-like protein
VSRHRGERVDVGEGLADQHLRSNKKREQARSPRYTSKIIKAGALLADTKTLLSHWDVRASISENLDRLHRENVFGKASRSRVKNILAILRQRYLREESVATALVSLVNHRFPASSLDRLFYFHSARADRLLFDIVTEGLLPLKVRGIMDIEVTEVERTVAKWVREGKTTSLWGENTICRVTQGLLSTLRDFGVLAGVVNKRFAPTYLPIEAFAYIMFYLKQRQPSGAKLIDLPDWKLFFLPPEGVERLLVEAHQQGLLEYHAAGTVTRLTFPSNSLEDYAYVLAETAH